jgi:CheY-like chemotaxis protein
MTNRILIVDDDSELREALVEQLALHEFEPIAVDNGTKGVQTAKVGQIDLVIMDVGLPDVDGREAARILRKNGFKAPIIMLTGHNTDSDTNPRARIRCQRLRDQAFSLCRAARAHPRSSAPARGERGRRLHHRPLYVPAKLENPAQS